MSEPKDLIPEDIDNLTPDSPYLHGPYCDCLECIVIDRWIDDGGPD